MALAENKRAYFDYEILDKYEAGVSLRGFEVKAIRSGRINISGAFVVIKNEEAWLLNADIPPYQPDNAPENYDSKRSRRLLLKKPEIRELIGKTNEKGLTLMPLKVYTKNHKIKLEIGLGKAKKSRDKREAIKKKEVKREIRKAKLF